MSGNTVANILKSAGALNKKQDRVDFLKAHDSYALRSVLQLALDPRVKSVLPEGAPPYKANETQDQSHQIHRESRKLYLFVEGGAPGLTQSRKELLFVQFLESVAADDALLVIDAKERRLPKGLTEDVVRAAFPDLLP